jgi:hypothetical protein
VSGGNRNPEPAQPFTPLHLEKLEEFACGADTPPEKAHITADLVFCILCCLRICQEQDCWISGIKAGQFIQDVVFKNKNPNPMKQCTRLFFGVLFGLCGHGWYDTWWSRSSKTDKVTPVIRLGTRCPLSPGYLENPRTTARRSDDGLCPQLKTRLSGLCVLLPLENLLWAKLRDYVISRVNPNPRQVFLVRVVKM